MKYKIIIASFLLFSSNLVFSQEVINAPLNDIENISQNNYQYIFSGSAKLPKGNIEKDGKDGKYNQIETDFKSMTCPVREINRTIDGSCNNISNDNTAQYGMAGIQQRRSVPDVYNFSSDLVGLGRRNPRDISNLVFEMNGEAPSQKLSSFVFTWAQFLDHDITLTPEGEESVYIPQLPGDIIMGSFHRSDFLSGTGINGIPREQLNLLTAWIDASNVYGSDTAKANSLRTFIDGKMKTSIGNNGEETLPIVDGEFLAGDIRALEQPGLTSLHVLFLREHNRICSNLVACGMTDDEVIYQKARKQVGALVQSISYNEFLPALGIDLPNYTGYYNAVQPDIMNVFSTAAYRFGHTMVTDTILLFDDFGNRTGSFPLSQVFFNDAFISDNGIEVIFNGLAQQFQEEIDAKMVESLRSFLFTESPTGPGLDLAALNIQRVRDHGLDDYNAFRVAFGIPAANNFTDITSNVAVQNELAIAYHNNVNDIDVWVGLLAEDHLPGSSVGPTLHAILATQFTSLRDGDFYFYENDPSLTETEKNIIRNTRLSDIIKRNTNINNIKADVFYGPCQDLSQGCILDTGDCGCDESEVCENGYCISNSDPDACICYTRLEVANYGNCTVELYQWLPIGVIYIADIPAGGSYWVTTSEGETWRTKVGSFGSLYFDDVYTVTGCDNQTFGIYPCPNCPYTDYMDQAMSGTDTYSVSDELTASNVVQPSANITYTAGNRIQFLPDFKAYEGSDFHAFIAPCSSDNEKSTSENLELDQSTLSDKEIAINISLNPTNDIVMFTYDLAQESKVLIVILDEKGKEVVLLEENSLKEAGSHSLKLDAHYLTNGLYNLRIKSEDFINNQSFVIGR